MRLWVKLKADETAKTLYESASINPAGVEKV